MIVWIRLRATMTALLFHLLLTFTAQDSIRFDFAPANTQIRWTLGGGAHAVHGTFKLVSGAATFDPTTGVGTGEFVADARSGESGNGSRDKHMHKEILESSKYPQIIFVANSFKGTLAPEGLSHVDIQGTFKVHGTEHILTVPADVESSPGKVTVRSRFEIPYVEWGLKNPSNFLLKVDSKVTIDIETTGKPSPTR
jgi:polyisoprenoid-binding protein YceI